jgi:glyoxylase-like metal-dependent hydrolase (beta-lactamase superfamily II)
MIKVKEMSLGPLGTNCYIVHNHEQALVIDPGGEANKVVTFLREEQLSAQAILLTHAHFDHIGGVQALRTDLDLDVYLHQNELEWLSNPDLNRSRSFGSEIVTDRAEHTLKPGTLQIGPFQFDVLHTPGHSPGSVSFVFAEAGFVISGDVLFRLGIGRTDLPGGDIRKLELSIKNQLYALRDSLIVYPGHGPRTTIEAEKENNPFFPA